MSAWVEDIFTAKDAKDAKEWIVAAAVRMSAR